MTGLTAVLGAPRTKTITLKNGTQVTIRELSIAETWPYMNGGTVDPDVLIRVAVIDHKGEPLIKPQDGIPMAQALELLPHILKLSHLETNDPDSAPEVADLKADFPEAAQAG